MLVVMRSGSTPEMVDEVLRRAKEAGLDASVFGDSASAAIQSSGGADNEEHFASVPGVERVLTTPEPAVPVTYNLRIAGIRPLIRPPF